jgi:SAM-dependent methyltransferase
MLLNAADQAFSDQCEQNFSKYLLPPVTTFRESVMDIQKNFTKCLEHSIVGKCYEMVPESRELTINERELIAWITGTPPLYIGDEAVEVQKAEAQAALRSLPAGVPTSKLNILDIGAGGRRLDDNVIPYEPHRHLDLDLPAYQKPFGTPILGWADNLPFASSSLDAIISLHNLEHLENPVNFLLDALDIVKPGGGVGIIVPNVFFAWDPAGDLNPWGHRWASDPVTMCKMFHIFLEPLADVEHFVSYEHRISFDFILRKKGNHTPFDDDAPNYATGMDKARQGERWHGNGDTFVWERANRMAEKLQISVRKRTYPNLDSIA